MISVQNHLPPLSGNKWLLFLGVILLAGACSPKVRPPATPVKTDTQKPIPPQTKPIIKPAPVVASVSLLLPFSLDHLSPGSSYTATTLQQANIAVDYYQGFKLALDSLTAQGYNFELNLFDTRGVPSQSHALAYNPKVRSSDLIVGPIFPEDLKAFSSVLTSARKPIVSPLSPAAPATINNQNIITAVPPLEYHAYTAAQYIKDKLKAKKVFILKSGYSEENDYVNHFKKGMDSLSKKQIQTIPLTVVRGNLTPLAKYLNKTGENVFVVPSTNQAFLMTTLKSLDTLAYKYPVTLFGHPNWEKFAFLKAAVLQRLKTHITNADHINYKSANTIAFIRDHRKKYRTEPTDYAIKGFDEGLYFGSLLGKDKDGYPNDIDKKEFAGIHNRFNFVKVSGMGWINTHVDVLRYANFELKRAE